MIYGPLAKRIRPESLAQVVGQEHILGEGKVLRRALDSGSIPNMIFYGPPGVGKTTVASIIAKNTNRTLRVLNGTECSTADIRSIISESGSMTAPEGVLLYIDEIQYLTRKQQQVLLKHIEEGGITFIAATTENPYFYVFGGILSRCSIFEFKPLSKQDVKKAVLRGIDIVNAETGKSCTIDEDALDYLCEAVGGDVRKALNAVELLFYPADGRIDMELTEQAIQKSFSAYDKEGDSHYDLLSAFQKSVRGSDGNAAVFYLAKLLEAGDLPSVCRRMLVIAAEDVGLAYPQALYLTKAAVDSALQLGMPEARIPLAEAVIFLATAPKSNSAICAVDEALADVRAGLGRQLPDTLRDSHYEGAKNLGRGKGYVYPHGYPDNYYPQQYLPEDIKNKKYYSFDKSSREQKCAEYWDKVKNNNKE